MPPAILWRAYARRARRLATFSPWVGDSFYHVPPVAQAGPVSKILMGLETAPTWKEWVPDLQPEILTRYRERFIGLPPYLAGERMLAELETLAG